MDQAQTEDNLLAKLGAELESDLDKGISPPTRRQLIEKAKTWLKTNQDEIRIALNKDPKLKKMAFEQRQEQVIIAAVADALAASFVGAPVLTIATLIVHYGLDTYLS